MNPNDLIIQPVISEKTTALMEQNKYIFKVPVVANKQMIANAVTSLFGVRPKNVNIMMVRGKTKRVRYQFGKKTAWKKAIVTLKAGDKIEVFEGQ
jgi:large subunit ribosomal protein L23